MNINLLFSDAKEFLSNELNRIFIAVLITGLGICYMNYSYSSAILKSNAEVRKALEKTNKKIDFRYFNTTTTLEKIHNVEINTKTGELKR